MRDVYRIELPDNRMSEQIKYSVDLYDARRSYAEIFPLNPSGIIPGAPSPEFLFGEDPERGSYEFKELFYFKYWFVFKCRFFIMVIKYVTYMNKKINWFVAN